MDDMFYLIYSPSLKMWRDVEGEFGPIAKAEKFNAPDECVVLEGAERWVGPMMEGEHE